MVAADGQQRQAERKGQRSDLPQRAHRLLRAELGHLAKQGHNSPIFIPYFMIGSAAGGVNGCAAGSA
jgi:hypothetical protein